MALTTFARVQYDPARLHETGPLRKKMLDYGQEHFVHGNWYQTVRITALGNKALRELCHTQDQKTVWRFPSYSFVVRKGSISVEQLKTGPQSYLGTAIATDNMDVPGTFPVNDDYEDETIQQKLLDRLSNGDAEYYTKMDAGFKIGIEIEMLFSQSNPSVKSITLSAVFDVLEAGGLRQVRYNGPVLKEHPPPVIEVDDGNNEDDEENNGDDGAVSTGAAGSSAGRSTDPQRTPRKPSISASATPASARATRANARKLATGSSSAGSQRLLEWLKLKADDVEFRNGMKLIGLDVSDGEMVINPTTYSRSNARTVACALHTGVNNGNGYNREISPSGHLRPLRALLGVNRKLGRLPRVMLPSGSLPRWWSCPRTLGSSRVHTRTLRWSPVSVPGQGHNLCPAASVHGSQGLCSARSCGLATTKRSITTAFGLAERDVCLADSPEHHAGHELDWLALDMGHIDPPRCKREWNISAARRFYQDVESVTTKLENTRLIQTCLKKRFLTNYQLQNVFLSRARAGLSLERRIGFTPTDRKTNRDVTCYGVEVAHFQSPLSQNLHLNNPAAVYNCEMPPLEQFGRRWTRKLSREVSAAAGSTGRPSIPSILKPRIQVDEGLTRFFDSLFPTPVPLDETQRSEAQQAMIEPSETSHALPFSRMPPQWGRVSIQFKYSLADEGWEAKACQQFFEAASALMRCGAPELTLTAYVQLRVGDGASGSATDRGAGAHSAVVAAPPGPPAPPPPPAPVVPAPPPGETPRLPAHEQCYRCLQAACYRDAGELPFCSGYLSAPGVWHCASNVRPCVPSMSSCVGAVADIAPFFFLKCPAVALPEARQVVAADYARRATHPRVVDLAREAVTEAARSDWCHRWSTGAAFCQSSGTAILAMCPVLTFHQTAKPSPRDLLGKTVYLSLHSRRMGPAGKSTSRETHANIVSFTSNTFCWYPEMAQLRLTSDQKHVLWSPRPTLRVFPNRHTTRPSESKYTPRQDQTSRWLEFPRYVLERGRHEVFFTLMTPGTRYIEYLERTASTITAEPGESMKKQSFRLQFAGRFKETRMKATMSSFDYEAYLQHYVDGQAEGSVHQACVRATNTDGGTLTDFVYLTEWPADLPTPSLIAAVAPPAGPPAPPPPPPPLILVPSPGVPVGAKWHCYRCLQAAGHRGAGVLPVCSGYLGADGKCGRYPKKEPPYALPIHLTAMIGLLTKKWMGKRKLSGAATPSSSSPRKSRRKSVASSPSHGPSAQVPEFNNKAALDLLQLHLEELETALEGFADKQIKWRCDRRNCELDLGKWLYAKHNDYLSNHSSHSKTTEDDINDSGIDYQGVNHINALALGSGIPHMLMPGR
ncbi:hypothetical protein CNMCM5793_005635 [Aspergillus hiratsukae]|uniref:Uncharacterized protein n=1 Tax=Aspergillus hiratsukae TaxID=1194566 RepID=A0A8H6P3Q3_9EURO|nr:hypothetical protein CNMCM5793_005635 [Aspergillus hiratsukae]KAF7168394.1 hypothetical protein CNMCM6106_003608 [Aspergillus hiratsukae]